MAKRPGELVPAEAADRALASALQEVGCMHAHALESLPALPNPSAARHLFRSCVGAKKAPHMHDTPTTQTQVAGRRGTALIVAAGAGLAAPDDLLTPWARRAQALGETPLFLATDAVALDKARALGLRAVLSTAPRARPPRSSGRAGDATAAAGRALAKWAAIWQVLSHGYGVVYCDLDVALLRSPLKALLAAAKGASHAGGGGRGGAAVPTDVEAMSAAGSAALARGAAVEAPGSGGGGGGAAIRVGLLSTALLHLRPTPAAMALAASMRDALWAAAAGTDGAASFGAFGEAELLTRRLLLPGFGGGGAGGGESSNVDGAASGGPLRVRLLPPESWVSGAALFSADGGAGTAAALRHNGVVAVHVGGGDDRDGGASRRLERVAALHAFAAGRPAALEALLGGGGGGGGGGSGGWAGGTAAWRLRHLLRPS